MDTRTEWLAEVVREAEKIPLVEDYIAAPSGKRYGVGRRLGSSTRFTLYESVWGECITGTLKIAKSREDNHFLDQEAMVLGLLAAKAAKSEKESKEKMWSHDRIFSPRLIESFIAKSRDNCRVNILGFPETMESLTELTPISTLREIEHVRVDPRTGAWMLGKMLKVLSFIHEQGISNAPVGNNILIERERYELIFFDWTHAVIHSNGVPQKIARAELSAAGRIATLALGGDLKTGIIPADSQLTDKRFEEYLHKLIDWYMADAAQARDEFYTLIRELWPQEFHPFTTYEL